MAVDVIPHDRFRASLAPSLVAFSRSLKGDDSRHIGVGSHLDYLPVPGSRNFPSS